jgi:IclR family KDG regulon transcriptional repressor
MGRTVPAVARAIQLLELFLDEPGPLSIPQITASLGIHRSSVHELVRTLLQHGLLAEAVERPNRYVLGSRMFDFGNAYAARIDLLTEAQHITRAIATACEESVSLAVLDGIDVTYVVKADGTHLMRTVTYPGRRLKAHCTGAGKMLLAGLSDEELTARFQGVELIGMTDHSIDTFEHLRSELAEIRMRQLSFDDNEAHLGVRCLAAPIYDHTGSMVAAMSISGPSVRVSDERQPALETILRGGALDLSHRLGYRPQAARRSSPAPESALAGTVVAPLNGQLHANGTSG